MKKWVTRGRCAFVAVLFSIILALFVIPKGVTGLFFRDWMDTAAASDPPPQTSQLALAPGAPVGPLSWSGGIVASFGTSCQDCLQQGFTDYPYCNNTGMANVGWPPGYWGNTGNNGDGSPYWYLDCVYPLSSEIAAYLVPKNWTTDFGSSGSSDSSQADPSNGELTAQAMPSTICGGSTIDLKTGNVYHSQTVGPLTFSYNSLDTYNGPLGPGWTHDFNIFLTANADGSLFLNSGDGNKTWYNGTGNIYHADAKSKDSSSLVKNSDGTYTRTSRYGEIWYFDASGRLTRMQDRNGNTTDLSYTGNDLTGIVDHATARTVAIGVDAGKIVSITQPISASSNRTYVLSYDSGYLSAVSDTSDPLSTSTWLYSYSNGRMSEKKDPLGNSTTYYYNSDGKLSYLKDPQNGIKRVDPYNSGNQKTWVTEKDQQQWTYSYYAEFSLLHEVTDSLGNKTTYNYDLRGNLTSIIYPDSTSEAFTYDANTGNMTSRTDRRGKTTTFGYDARKGGGGLRVTEITDTAANVDYVTHITYDTKGNTETITDRAGGVTRFQRNGNGNITRVTDPLGNETIYGYENSEIVSITDPSGNITRIHRDMLGNITGIIDPLGHATQFEYNPNARLANVRNHMQQETTFDYDANGNLSLLTDPLGNPTVYAHDYQGQITGITDALGKTITISYTDTECASCNGDSRRIASVTDSLLGRVAAFTYFYDPTNRTYTTRYAPDPIQASLTITDTASTRQRIINDRNGNHLTYTYTPTGKLEAITYPDQTQAVYTYDDLDRLDQIHDGLGYTDYTYDGAGRITGQTDPHGFALSFAYDLAGNLTRLTYPDGSMVTYAYDALNHLSTVRNWLSDTVYDEASYTYDEAGNLSSFTQFNGVRTDYSYDDANRLTDLVNTVAEYHLALDANGNRTSSEERTPLGAIPPAGTVTYTYDGHKTRLLSAGSTGYGYDAEGQLTRAGNTNLTFDYNHRLATIGSTTQFGYDGRGNRISVTRAGAETLYVYDPWGNLLATWDGTAGFRKYVYGRGLIALQVGAARYCYHFNPTGGTVALTDMSGAVVNSYAYDPFGVILTRHEQVAQPFQFVGQYGVMAEPEGLYYMRARYYDPNVGRFISEDPIGFGGGDVNLYAYVQNNPLKMIDPYGLSGYLTIYSSGNGDGSSGSGGISGHSWISYTPDGGTTTTYGTWGNNPLGLGNGLHENLESGRDGDASRITYLDDQQEATLYKLIQSYKDKGKGAWGYLSPCSTFASDAWNSTTGGNLTPYGPYSNPSTLKNSIVNANRQQSAPHIDLPVVMP